MTQPRRTRDVKGFPQLWLAQVVSLFGNQVSLIAIPTLAIFGVQASDTEVGILRGLEWVFFPLLALWFGVFADRSDVRIFLIVADLLRFVALVGLLAAAMTGRLSMPLMFAVAALIGMGSVMFNVAFMVQVPRMTPRSLLGRANARMAVPQSVAEVAGPGAAALVIQAIGAIASILVDALSYLASALLILKITGSPNREEVARRSVLRDMAEGIRLIRRSRVLRSLCWAAAGGNFAFGVVSTVLILFAYRQLDLNPGMYGIALSVGSLGAVAASLVAPHLHRLFGYARSMTIGMAIFALGILTLPLAALSENPWAAAAIMTCGWFMLSFGTPLFDIAQVTIRQAITPAGLQGRMNAAVRTVVFGALPLGAFCGGWAGEKFGYTWVLLVAGVCAAIACVCTTDRSTRFLSRDSSLQHEARVLEAAMGIQT